MGFESIWRHCHAVCHVLTIIIFANNWVITAFVRPCCYPFDPTPINNRKGEKGQWTTEKGEAVMNSKTCLQIHDGKHTKRRRYMRHERNKPSRGKSPDQQREGNAVRTVVAASCYYNAASFLLRQRTMAQSLLSCPPGGDAADGV